MLKDHHEGYIEWSEFERNQGTLAGNNYRKPGSGKSARGGRALLAGIITCARCGRRLPVSYTGRGTGYPVYRCDRSNQMLGLPRCLGFGGSRIDAAIGAEILRAISPLAVDAARHGSTDIIQDFDQCPLPAISDRLTTAMAHLRMNSAVLKRYHSDRAGAAPNAAAVDP